MRRALPDAEVFDYESLLPATTCDAKDRYVLAAAISGGAEVLVTFNVSDFPAESVAEHDIGVVTPDACLLDQIDLHPAKVGPALVTQMTEATRQPLTMGELLGRLSRLASRPSRRKRGVTSSSEHQRHG